MKSFAFVVIIASIFLQINTAPFEVDKSYLRVPPEIETARLIYEGSEFKMILSDEKTYTFKLESIDPHLRFVDPISLRFYLGMAWKFECDETNMVASDNTTAEELIHSAHDCKVYESGDPLSEFAISSRPERGYLEIYKMDNNEYGIHIHERVYKKGLMAWLRSIFFSSQPEFDTTKKLTIGTAIEYPKDDSERYEYSQDDNAPRPGESQEAFKRRKAQEHDDFMKALFIFAGIAF